MKPFCIFTVVFLLMGLFSVSAQDLIVLRDGNMIEAKVMEISPSEIRYKRIDNLDGPMIIVPKDSVLSIKYENGVVDIINEPPATAQEKDQTDGAGSSGGKQLSMPTALQNILNALPAIPIAGNNLKFQFESDKWTATVNGENFSAGTIELEDTDDGSILTLKQTHIWPGAVGKTAGRLASRIPGGAAVGNALDTAGKIAGAVGAIEASGPEMVLEYKAGPPAKLSYLRSARTVAGSSNKQLTDGHPLLAENRFDLDGFNVFAISLTGIPPLFRMPIGAGVTFTLFEKYKPDALFTPSYFLSGKFFNFPIDDNDYDDWNDNRVDVFALGAGVLFKHRFPRNRLLWNFGASLELMWVSGYFNNVNYDYQEGTTYTDTRINSFLVGIDIRTGFSFRFNPYTSLDINGLFKFPFGTVDMSEERQRNYSGGASGGMKTKSVWPFTGGIELGFTFWFPYRSRE